MKIFDKKAAIARLAVLLLSFVLWVSLLAPSAVAQETRAQTDQLEALIDVLRDDQSREAFIAQLEDAIGLPPESVQAAETPADISFGRRLALLTQSIAQDSAERVGQAVAGISSAGATLSGLGIDEVSILTSAHRF